MVLVGASFWMMDSTGRALGAKRSSRLPAQHVGAQKHANYRSSVCSCQWYIILMCSEKAYGAKRLQGGIPSEAWQLRKTIEQVRRRLGDLDLSLIIPFPHTALLHVVDCVTSCMFEGRSVGRSGGTSCIIWCQDSGGAGSGASGVKPLRVLTVSDIGESILFGIICHAFTDLVFILFDVQY